MKELQLTLYDFLSILLPAVLLLAILYYQTGLNDHSMLYQILSNIWDSGKTMLVSTNTGQAVIPANLPGIADLTLAFAVAFLLGHATNIITKLIQKTKGLRQLLLFPLGKWIPTFMRNASPISTTGEVIFYSRSFPFTFRKEIADKITKKLKKIYDVEFNEQEEEDLSDFLVPFLTDKEATKRDIFISTACMMRNTAFLGFVFTFYYLFEGVAHREQMGNDLAFTVISFLAFLIFRSGFQHYEWKAERKLFTSFLSAPMPDKACIAPE